MIWHIILQTFDILTDIWLLTSLSFLSSHIYCHPSLYNIALSSGSSSSITHYHHVPCVFRRGLRGYGSGMWGIRTTGNIHRPTGNNMQLLWVFYRITWSSASSLIRLSVGNTVVHIRLCCHGFIMFDQVLLSWFHNVWLYCCHGK